MNDQLHRRFSALCPVAAVALIAVLAGLGHLPSAVPAAHATPLALRALPALLAGAPTPTTLPIAQVPLIAGKPSHPQVLFAVTDSESMDGNLSGAIMTGSGSATILSTYVNTAPDGSMVGPGIPASPNNFSLSDPNATGYTPQIVNIGGTTAPYTVTCAQIATAGLPCATGAAMTDLVDNSPSRLNVAKQGMQATIGKYLGNADFGVIYYKVSPTVYPTWVYYMGTTGLGWSGFSMTSTPPSGTRYVANPCYGYSLGSTQSPLSNCTSFANTYYGSTATNNSLYMTIGASSDDPNINDVLYSTGLASLFMVQTAGALTGASLNSYWTYNSYISTSNLVGSTIGSLYPTNAGYDPPPNTAVLYVRRGFSYSAAVGATIPGGAGIGGTVISSTITSVSTPSQAATAMGLFTNALAPETNDANSQEIKSVAGQSPIAGLITYAKNVRG